MTKTWTTARASRSTRYAQIGDLDQFQTSLRAALHKRGWTQGQLAAELEVTSSAVSMWVGGKAFPDPPTVFEIEEILGIFPGRLSRHLGYVPIVRADRRAAALQDGGS